MHYKSVPALAAYIDRVGAEELSFKRFIVREFKGNYYTERAIIRIIPETLDIYCSNKEYAPTAEEAEAIKKGLEKVKFPRSIKAKNIDGLKKELKGDHFIFIDRHDTRQIIMVQERRMMKDGTKKYLPWTFWSDGEWRMMEPDGDLPLWKPNEHKQSKIMIHEGAKAAAFCDKLCSDPERLSKHPWGEFLQSYAHWGLIGGALAPHRADYKEISRENPTEVIYVCDNDFSGKAALAQVSKAYGKSLKGVMFDKRFPLAWDLADPMPKSLFNGSRYIGPQIQEFLIAATRATEVIPAHNGTNRTHIVIRRDFQEEWLHCVQPEVFVHRDWPNRIRTKSEFNNEVSPYSDVDDTARLLQKDAASKSAVLKYDPSAEPGIYGSGASGRFINTHMPSPIEPEKGDPTPWIDFMSKLVPDPYDRTELLRWVCTLVSRPDIKMLYGVLMISEIQGVGKGTLGEKILAPLVGESNVSYPPENEIVDSAFNYWLAHKRLAVVHEIYAGHSAKAYNRLKSIITDKNITVSKKYQANYEIENWVHVFACSNSRRALKLAEDDRRWFIPKISELKQTSTYWIKLNKWLEHEGGLNIIRWWCDEWLKVNSPVMKGESAPMSVLKAEIVEEGYSPGQALTARVLDQIKLQVEAGELPPTTFVLDTALVELVKTTIYEGRHNDRLERPATLRQVARARGWHAGDTRAQIKEWGQKSFGSRVLALDPTIAKTLPSRLCSEQLDPELRKQPLQLSKFVEL